MTKHKFELQDDGELPDWIDLETPPGKRKTRSRTISPATMWTLVISMMALLLVGGVVMFNMTRVVVVRAPAFPAATVEAVEVAQDMVSKFANIPSCMDVPLTQSSKIVFRAQEHYLLELFRVDADGLNLCRLTRNNIDEFQPAVSPDYSQIAFVARTPDYHYNLFVMDINGMNRRQLTVGETYAVSPSWSPDGTQIVFSAYNEQEIVIIDADGENMRSLTDALDTRNTQPSWSHDGQKIVFVAGYDEMISKELYSMDADGTNITQMTHNQLSEVGPDLSPDGESLIYVEQGDLFISRVDGSNVRRLSDDHVYNGVWSPDGAYIAFAAERCDDCNHNRAVFVMDRNGHNVRQITDYLQVSDIDWR